MPVIATNTSANTALTFLNRNSEDQANSLAKLSSGSRIVVASDDAAGLGVSNRLQADISTLQQASRNALQGRAVLQTADGALDRIGDILQRLNSLAAQAISGSVDNVSRGFIDAEYQQLVTEITDIGTQTQFNGSGLIDGSFTGTLSQFQVGLESGDVIDADLSAVNIGTLVGTLGDVTTAANADGELTAVGAAIDAISTARAEVGSFISRFEFRGEYIQTATENLQAANSSIVDVDIAAEQTNLVTRQVLTEASIAALAQANQSAQSILALVR